MRKVTAGRAVGLPLFGIIRAMSSPFQVAEVPEPETVSSARTRVGLTQAQAAKIVGLSSPSRWSEYERGARVIDMARWELFLIKTGQHANYRPARGVPVPKARKGKGSQS